MKEHEVVGFSVNVRDLSQKSGDFLTLWETRDQKIGRTAVRR